MAQHEKAHPLIVGCGDLVVSALNKNHGNDVIHTGQQFFDRATCMRNRESTCIPMLQYNALRVAIPHPNGSAVGCHK